MKKLILALLMLSVTIGTLAACADNTGDTESATDTATEATTETDTETEPESATETTPDTETEPESETETNCEHIFVDDVCTKCGATQTYIHTVKVVYGATVSDQTMAGKPLAGVGLLITTDTSMITQGTTNEEGIFTFEAPRYTDPLTGVRGYSVVITSDLPKGYAAPESCYLLSETCEGTVELGDSNTAFRPEKVSVGSTTHCEMTTGRTYYYAVQPSKPEHVGHYRVSIENATAGVTLTIGHYASNAHYVSPTPRVSDTGEAPAIEFNMEEQYLQDSTGTWTYPNYWLIGIKVEGEATYPVEFDLKVEKLRDLVAGKDYAINDRERVQIVEGCKPADEITGAVSGTLTYVDTAATLVKDENGYYHVNTVDGPLVMLNIANPNRIFGEDGEASFLTVNSLSGVENLLVSWSETRDDLSYNVVRYYADMFASYGELCNADGAYPLNEQLYDFLYAWVNQRVSVMIKGDLDADHAFLLACSYYAEANADS